MLVNQSVRLAIGQKRIYLFNLIELLNFRISMKQNIPDLYITSAKHFLIS